VAFPRPTEIGPGVGAMALLLNVRVALPSESVTGPSGDGQALSEKCECGWG
jgi:hypothetical protein